MRRTSPAKMFPNRRNVKLMTLAISPIPSRTPTNRPIGPALKLMNLLRCPKIPSVVNPQKCTMNMATSAIARVVLTSVLALLKNGIRCPACFPSPAPWASS